MANVNTDTFLENNKKYASGETVHDSSSHPGAQPINPAKHVAVVACMDARMDVEDILGHGCANGCRRHTRLKNWGCTYHP